MKEIITVILNGVQVLVLLFFFSCVIAVVEEEIKYKKLTGHWMK